MFVATKYRRTPADVSDAADRHLVNGAALLAGGLEFILPISLHAGWVLNSVVTTGLSAGSGSEARFF